MKKHLINSNKKQPEGFLKFEEDPTKFILPKFENYPHHDKGLLMCFTINPKEQYFQYVDRLIRVTEDVTKMLHSEYASYELYVELSPTSRIHYHGYIKIYDYTRWLMLEFPQMQDKCTIAIKDTLGLDRNVDGWDVYVTKQQPHHGLKPVIIRRMKIHETGHETKSYLANSSKGQFHRGCHVSTERVYSLQQGNVTIA